MTNARDPSDDRPEIDTSNEPGIFRRAIDHLRNYDEARSSLTSAYNMMRTREQANTMNYAHDLYEGQREVDLPFDAETWHDRQPSVAVRIDGVMLRRGLSYDIVVDHERGPYIRLPGGAGNRQRMVIEVRMPERYVPTRHEVDRATLDLRQFFAESPMAGSTRIGITGSIGDGRITASNTASNTIMSDRDRILNAYGRVSGGLGTNDRILSASGRGQDGVTMEIEHDYPTNTLRVRVSGIAYERIRDQERHLPSLGRDASISDRLRTLADLLDTSEGARPSPVAKTPTVDPVNTPVGRRLEL